MMQKTNVRILDPEEINLRGLVHQQKERIAKQALQIMVLTKYLSHIERNFDLSKSEREMLESWQGEFAKNFL